MITPIDYCVDNLGSAQNMWKKLGAESTITLDIATIECVANLIHPGCGAFDACIAQVNDSDIRPALNAAVFEPMVPVVSICLGMRRMTDGSEEDLWEPNRKNNYLRFVEGVVGQ